MADEAKGGEMEVAPAAMSIEDLMKDPEFMDLFRCVKYRALIGRGDAVVVCGGAQR